MSLFFTDLKWKVWEVLGVCFPNFTYFLFSKHIVTPFSPTSLQSHVIYQNLFFCFSWTLLDLCCCAHSPVTTTLPRSDYCLPSGKSEILQCFLNCFLSDSHLCPIVSSSGAILFCNHNTLSFHGHAYILTVWHSLWKAAMIRWDGTMRVVIFCLFVFVFTTGSKFDKRAVFEYAQGWVGMIHWWVSI